MKPQLPGRGTGVVRPIGGSGRALCPGAGPTRPTPRTSTPSSGSRTKACSARRSWTPLWYLTDVHGPRLTNSPGIRAAADVGGKRLTRLGRRQRPPGDLGTVRPRLGQREVHRQRRRAAAVPADRASRARGRRAPNGPVTAEVVAAAIRTDEDMAAWSGKLAGKIVLLGGAGEVRALFTPLGRRFTDRSWPTCRASR